MLCVRCRLGTDPASCLFEQACCQIVCQLLFDTSDLAFV